jgi:hypothetical protein
MVTHLVRSSVVQNHSGSDVYNQSSSNTLQECFPGVSEHNSRGHHEKTGANAQRTRYWNLKKGWGVAAVRDVILFLHWGVFNVAGKPYTLNCAL